MANQKRRTDRRLIELFAEQPHRYSLVQAARIVQAATGVPPRYRAAIDGAFRRSDVLAVHPEAEGDAIALETGSITFFGMGGALPAPVAQVIQERERAGDPSMRRFFEIFSHRFTQILIDTVRLETPAARVAPPSRGPHADVLRSLLGRLDHRGESAQIADWLMASTGVLHQRPVSLNTIAAVVTNHFGTPATCRGLVGGWVKTDPSDCAKVSSFGGARLGRNSALGTRAWLQDAGTEIRMGPIDAATRDGFLPIQRPPYVGQRDGRRPCLAALGAIEARRPRGVLRTLGSAIIPAESDLICVLEETPEAAVNQPVSSARSVKRTARLGFTSRLASSLAPAPATLSTMLGGRE
ncbi:MAG: type VI secretion system baseplate subunit TssG [Pseudomonadota bacterium]